MEKNKSATERSQPFRIASVIFKLTQDGVSPELARLARTAKNPTPVLRAMGMVFKSITEGTFNSVGAAFRPIPWKNKRDGSPSNLQKSTTLSKSFVLTVTDQFAKVSVQGGANQYASAHQFGADIYPKSGGVLTWVDAKGRRWFAKHVHIPARPFFPVVNGQLTPAAAAKIKAAALRAIARQGA